MAELWVYALNRVYCAKCQKPIQKGQKLFWNGKRAYCEGCGRKVESENKVTKI